MIIYTYNCSYCGFKAAEDREETYYEVKSCKACGYRKETYYEVKSCKACGYRESEAKDSLYNEMGLDINEKESEKKVRDWLDKEEGKDYIPSVEDINRAHKIIASLEVIERDYNTFVLKHDLLDYMQNIVLFNKELLKVII